MFKRTYPGAAFNAEGRHVGPGPWLDVIRKVNGLAHDEDGSDGPFGAPTYTDDKPGVEQYADADVTHDYPLVEPPFPPDVEPYGHAWEAVARERDKVRDEWLRDPRNTVTITSKTPLGERLLKAAHAVVTKTCPTCGLDASRSEGWSTGQCDTCYSEAREPSPFEVVGVLSYDPETDTLKGA